MTESPRRRGGRRQYLLIVAAARQTLLRAEPPSLAATALMGDRTYTSNRVYRLHRGNGPRSCRHNIDNSWAIAFLHATHYLGKYFQRRLSDQPPTLSPQTPPQCNPCVCVCCLSPLKTSWGSLFAKIPDVSVVGKRAVPIDFVLHTIHSTTYFTFCTPAYQ